MKTTLHVVPHSVLPDHHVVEIWFENKLLGTITGADGPGVRILSKHIDPSDFAISFSAIGPPVTIVEVPIKPRS